MSSEYQPPFAFTGGSIQKVEVHVGDDNYIDAERHLAAAYLRD